MAGLDYLNSRATADRLIGRFGRSIIIVRATLTGSSYDPVVSEQSYPATAVIVDFTDKEIDGERILVGDKRVLVKSGGLSIEPTNTDRVEVEGISHVIVQVKPLNPGGTVVLYELQIRRS